MLIGARLCCLAGDDARLDKWADELVAVATERGFTVWGAVAAIFCGWVKVRNGDVAKGISLLGSGSSAYRASGAKLWMPHFIALRASASERAGHLEEALALLDEALQLADETGERWFVAELHRQKGQLLLRQDQVQGTEEFYHEALAIAQEQEAKLWELRAAVSLARLGRNQSRGVDARQLLSPVYDWFTEGFDTPDLREAKTLLEALQA